MPFQKGKSGNPNGRPKEVAEVRKAALGYSVEAIERLAWWMRGDNPKASVIASNAILDRGIGRAPQPIVGGEEDDESIKLSLPPASMEIIQQYLKEKGLK